MQVLSDLGRIGFDLFRSCAPVGMGVCFRIGKLTYDEFNARPRSGIPRAWSGVEWVLPELDPISVPIWLTTHREPHTNRRIRLVSDLLAESFS